MPKNSAISEHGHTVDVYIYSEYLFQLYECRNTEYSILVLFIYVFLCGSVVEHCVSSAKGCGFDSQGTHILMKIV